MKEEVKPWEEYKNVKEEEEEVHDEIIKGSRRRWKRWRIKGVEIPFYPTDNC